MPHSSFVSFAFIVSSFLGFSVCQDKRILSYLESLVVKTGTILFFTVLCDSKNGILYNFKEKKKSLQEQNRFNLRKKYFSTKVFIALTHGTKTLQNGRTQSKSVCLSDILK